MKIRIEIQDPRNLFDTFSHPIKHSIKPIFPFEDIDDAINWLEMLQEHMKQSCKEV